MLSGRWTVVDQIALKSMRVASKAEKVAGLPQLRQARKVNVKALDETFKARATSADR